MGRRRVLAAVSLGGAGHLNPLVPFLHAARRRGDEVLVVGPAALAGLVAAADLPFAAGGEPTEAEVAPIRERLPTAPPAEASELGNRELFGRLAARALLPSADVVVCHGGSGTVFAALAAGVPVVVVPVFADQFENGRRVASAGAGVVVEVDGGSRARVVDERDAPRIRAAVEAVLATPRHRARAQEIAVAMAAAPSAGEVLDELLGR